MSRSRFSSFCSFSSIPFTVLPSSSFWPPACCLYLIQQQYRGLHRPSTHRPSGLPRASILLVFDTVISLFWASTQLALLWNIILPATLSIRALAATVLRSSFKQDQPRIFLDCLIPPNPFQFGYCISTRFISLQRHLNSEETF